MITGGGGVLCRPRIFALSFKREHVRTAQLSRSTILKRRGSELVLAATGFREGSNSAHGDIRNREDLADVGSLDLLIECSAEPSVPRRTLAGDDRYLINTNLNRHDQLPSIMPVAHGAGRGLPVNEPLSYPIALAARPAAGRPPRTRFCHPRGRNKDRDGRSHGIRREFVPLAGSRSLYGATKLFARN